MRTAGDEPLVLNVDGRYIWAFTPARDGHAHRGGVLVEWPPALRPFLDGRARVRVADPSGVRVLRRRGGRASAPARAGSTSWTRRGCPSPSTRWATCAGRSPRPTTACATRSWRARSARCTTCAEGCGLEAYLNYGALLGAVRDGAMIAHDSDTDVCYLSHAESPADLILESYRIERELRRRGWTLLRMSGGDIKLLLPLSDGRQCHIDVFVAFRVAGTFYQLGNRSGQLPESAILPLSTIELHGFDVPGAGAPGADAGVRVRAGLAGARPVVQVRRPGPGHPPARRLAAGVPHRHGPVDGVLPRAGGQDDPASPVDVRPLGRRAGPEARGRRRPGLGHRTRLPVLRPPRPRRRGVRLLPERAGPGRPSGQAPRAADRAAAADPRRARAASSSRERSWPARDATSTRAS